MSGDADLPQGFAERYGPRALILGGSEGIGASFADALAAIGLDLTLVARSAQSLEATAARLRERHGVHVDTRQLDLTGPDLETAAQALIASHDFGLVIYNAGATHGVGLFLDEPVDKALNLLRLNCAGPLIFAHHALSAMRAKGRGGLILISSMSGMAGSGYVAGYAASKAFEITLTEGLHWELAREGVDVMCAVATLTDTPAMRRSGIQMDADPNFVAMDADAVALGALRNLGAAAVWFAAGEEAGRALRAAPRAALTDTMSRTSARLWGLVPD